MDHPIPDSLENYLGEGYMESDEYQSFPLAANFAELLDKLIPYQDVYDEEGNIIYKS